MTAPSAQIPPRRIVYFGKRCAFSLPPLASLVAAEHNIAGIVLPGPPFGPPVSVSQPKQSLPLTNSANAEPTIDELAFRAGAPIITTSDLLHAEAIAAIAQLEPDFIAVACYPHLLPVEVLRLPPLGCLNVHPSLLPRGRGPDPLFWMFRRGERETGVSIHLMDDRFDAGPVVLQERIDVPVGVRLSEMERQLATLGGDLLVQAIDKLSAGKAAPFPQDDALATHSPIPSARDYKIPSDLPARWAYSFARAVAPATDLLCVVVTGTDEIFSVADALDFDEDGKIDAHVRIAGDRITVQFQPGTVTFSLPTAE